jgi:hypothetical protein
MSGPGHHHLLHEVVKDFETTAAKLEHVIELLAADDSGTVDLGALHRAKDAAQRGASITRSATSQVRRAFD